MDEPGDDHSKWSKPDWERQISHDIYMWNLKKQTSEITTTKKKKTHNYREQTSGYQWGCGKGKGKDRGNGVRGTNYLLGIK